ncbi:hypothetical protein Tco_1179586, partial [Tanacetum coccineum]
MAGPKENRVKVAEKKETGKFHGSPDGGPERISKKRTKIKAKTRHGMEKHRKDKVKSKPKSKKSTVKADNEEYLI